MSCMRLPKKCMSLLLLTAAFACAEPALIPWPQTVTMNTGTLTLSAGSRIVAGDVSLAPLAEVLSQEVFRVTGLSLAVEGTNAVAGDVYLAYTADATVTGETYKLTVAEYAAVEADNYRAVAYGTVTLLQALTAGTGTNPQYTIPKMTIRDWPDVNYRGQMIDLARQWHTIDAVKEYVRLCRMYKVKYLQLHLSDDQSFTFPTTNYPAIPGPDTRKYTYEQMHDLEAYAVARGVTIIPEIDVPAHASRMCATMPALFGRVSANVIDFANTNVWNAMGKILNELCDVFQAAPYIHMGADEAGLGDFYSDPLTLAAITNYNVGSMGGMFNYFLNRMNDYIKARGKNMIVWEGFGIHSGNGRMDDDVSVMMFDNYRNAQTYYINNGYDAINASWYPLYILKNVAPPQQRIYGWDVYTFGNYRNAGQHRSYLDITQYEVTKTNNVPGAQMCSWEQPQETEIPTLRPHLPAVADKIWNRFSGKDYTDFTNRFTSTDFLLQKVLATGEPDAITPSATMNVYPDRIEIMWQAGPGYPWKYSLYRNTVNNSSGAQELARDITATEYTDLTAEEGQTYYYWVQAANNYGYSSFGGSADGRRGADADLVYAYEGFNYTPGTGLDQKQGGIGWSTAWDVTDSGGNPKIIDDNLTYPGLKTGGKCMNVTFLTDTPGFNVVRQTQGIQGYEGTEMWASFLLRVNNVGDGHLFVVPNKVWDTAMAKPWGRALGNTPYYCENGQQYFIVARYDCYNGKDRMYMWVNPPTDQEPSVYAEDVGINGNGDLGTGHDFQINIQGYGQNNFDIDEIRLGRSWKEVIGQEDREVPYKPMNVSASDGTYYDKIEITWDESRYATNYRVYRAESAGTNGALLIDGAVSVPSYYDMNIVTNTLYYYWVQAENELGISDFSAVAIGRATGAPPTISAYEGFDYPDGSALNNSNGGFGWAGNWLAVQFDGTNKSPGLAYIDGQGNELEVTGGNVRFAPGAAEGETYVQCMRSLNDTLGGKDGDTVWLSFLVNGNTITDKGFFLMMGGMQVGKTTGGGLGVYNGDGVAMSNDTTYYVVSRISYREGPDLQDVWVNPGLGNEPKTEEAVGHLESIFSGFTLMIYRGYAGEGVVPVIDIDELRLGRSWDNVAPVIPEPVSLAFVCVLFPLALSRC